MNVTRSKMKKLHWTDSEFDRTYFLVTNKLGHMTKAAGIEVFLIPKNDGALAVLRPWFFCSLIVTALVAKLDGRKMRNS